MRTRFCQAILTSSIVVLLCLSSVIARAQLIAVASNEPAVWSSAHLVEPLFPPPEDHEQKPKPVHNPNATTEEKEAERPISLKKLIPNILHDQKTTFSFPLQVLRGKHWKPVLGFTAATALLVVLDPYDEGYFRNRPGFQTYRTGPLRGRNTSLVVTMIPVATYVGGLVEKSSFAQGTALLAGEAIADTQILSWVMKSANGRLHPTEIPPHGNFRDTWFKWNGSWNNPGSFPSGHTMSAFAVSSIFSTRYREHRWVPWVAHGLAIAVALSRVPDQAHFPSDIFAGAVLGYAVTHYVVLRRP